MISCETLILVLKNNHWQPLVNVHRKKILTDPFQNRITDGEFHCKNYYQKSERNAKQIIPNSSEFNFVNEQDRKY